MLLIVNATSGVAWCCWWLCRKITGKVSSAAIVLRKCLASQMPSSKEPHVAREPMAAQIIFVNSSVSIVEQSRSSNGVRWW